MGESEFSDRELEAYLDEALDPDLSALIEQRAREDRQLLERLSGINARRDSGVHSMGEMWRRHQIGVPTREELQNYLLGILDDEHAAYIRFRVQVIKCRYTVANLEDLQRQQAEADGDGDRHDKYFASGDGYFDEDSDQLS